VHLVGYLKIIVFLKFFWIIYMNSQLLHVWVIHTCLHKCYRRRVTW